MENNGFSKNYSEAKNMYAVFLEEFSKEELNEIRNLIVYVKEHFPSTEEILMIKDGNLNSAMIATMNDNPLGLELMKNLHTKLKSYTSTNENKGFNILKYHHENVKFTVRRYIKENENSAVKKEYVDTITNEIIIMYVLKDWNDYLLNVVDSIITTKK